MPLIDAALQYPEENNRLYSVWQRFIEELLHNDCIFIFMFEVFDVLVMRQGRGSEATEVCHCV